LNSATIFLLQLPVLLFSVIAHEIAHGYAALRQGDPTAFQLGRLSWNPVRHIDPFLTILMPLMTFFGSGGTFLLGGAKPVPVNPRNYRHYKRGDIIVSLAGVATNLVIAIGCAIGILLAGALGRVLPAGATPTLGILQAMMLFGVAINLVLIAFNLLPIPPLDGSHVMKYLLPPKLSLHYQAAGRYGLFILIALLAFGGKVLQLWMGPAMFLQRLTVRVVAPYFLPNPLGL
jgi:Zn-dependent protease